MEKYFFVLGSHPLLSIAELNSQLHIDNYQLFDNVFIVKLAEKLKLNDFIKKVGGVVKVGKIIAEINEQNLDLTIIQTIKKHFPGNQKVIFGFSAFGDRISLIDLAMNIKRELKKQGIKSRWLNSREKNLSSVIITQNKMIELPNKQRKGIEFILIKTQQKLLVGVTIAAQDFKTLSFRDFGRPSRDDLSGMIPPKLAQIMINLAQVNTDQIILDPFCGSGTILTEAMLMGYKKIIGTDISSKAINDTQKNIKWIQTNFHIIIQPKLFRCDVKNLSKYLSNIDAIITEPYLGPQRGKINITQTIKKLEGLYSRALKEFNKILKPNRKIVMVWPVFCQKNKKHYINPDYKPLKITNPLPQPFLNKRGLLYGRPKQKVMREIIILTKI